MPRLNTSTYLHHHHQLKELWLIEQNAFSYMSPSDQLALHKYFQFASDKTEAQLVEHRHNVHALDPALPQCAGRAYAKLLRDERRRSYTPKGGCVSVRAITRTEPDIKMLAKVFVAMALDELRNAGHDRAA
ncbi:hypothetical protein QN239_07030 [Mycolicibacterium sp. Y3]